MAKKYEARGVAFVAISEDDPPGQIPLVTEFAQQVPGLERYAVLGDPEIESRFGVTSLPTLFIVDREGRLVQRFRGSTTEASVVGLIDRLLE
jgi:thiol-disulfide isomerase/thioredoxin